MTYINWIGLYTFIRREWERMFRVVIQTLVTPWISATLYILVFGFIVGTRIESIAGVKYIDFVLPGILMMNVLASAFSHSSSSVYMARFMKTIEEILVAPLSHLGDDYRLHLGRDRARNYCRIGYLYDRGAFRRGECGAPVSYSFLYYLHFRHFWISWDACRSLGEEF